MFVNTQPFSRFRYNQMLTQGPRIYTTPQIYIDFVSAYPYDQMYPFRNININRHIYQKVLI